jgi:hypothetical protein
LELASELLGPQCGEQLAPFSKSKGKKRPQKYIVYIVTENIEKEGVCGVFWLIFEIKHHRDTFMV